MMWFLSAWWHYAYTCIVEERIRPWSWQRIREHRERYRRYKQLYKQHLHSKPTTPNNSTAENTEQTKLQAQLDELEEHMDLANILMAREEAKIEVR